VFIAVGATIQVTGLQANAELGTIATSANANIFAVGLAAIGVIGPVNVWGEVDDDQTPNWQGINTVQSPDWNALSDTQSPSWTPIASTQDPEWGSVSETQTPDWQNKAA
jgi:hypothetical protein